MNKSSNGHPATGLELLQIAFIVLKLCNVIDWSWVWVLAPIWMVVALILVLAIIRAVLESRRAEHDVHV